MRRILLVLALLAAVAVAYFARAAWLNGNRLPAGLLQVNGRIEGDHVSIASKFDGRVAELLVREGDQVEAGQVVIRLDDDQVRARVSQARHEVAVDEAMIEAAEAEVDAAAAEIKAAETALSVLRKRVPLTIARTQADLDHAVAMAASADSTEGVLRKEYERARQLRENDAISEEELDQKRLAFLAASNDLTAARAAVDRQRKALAEAELGSEDVKRLEDEVAALRARHAKALATVRQRRAERAASLAALEEAQSTLDDLTIRAPTAGTVVSRMVDQGEVVPAGAPLFDVVNLDRLYLQVYVPEPEIGKVRLGNPARVHTDAWPQRPFDATVRYIASEAEFTPKEVQTVDERVKLVYAVRLYLDANPEHRLTPGLPADAVIRWDPDAPWMKPRW